MEQLKRNNDITPSLPTQDEFHTNEIKCPCANKSPSNRPLRLRYDEIIKKLKEQEKDLTMLKREIEILKKVIIGRK